MTARRGKGEGCVSKRPSGKFRTYVTIDGQRLHFTGTTKAECQNWIRKTLNQVDAGLTAKGASTTFKDYLEWWIKGKENKLGPQTYKDYSRYCKVDIATAIGDKKLKDLRLPIFNSFYATLFENGKGIPTIAYIHRVIHSALDDAVQDGYLGFNPSDHAERPKQKSHRAIVQMTLNEMAKHEADALDWFSEDVLDGEMKIWSENEMSQFLIAAQSSPHYALYDLEAKTGLRVSEALGLLKTDVLFKDGYALIRVRRQVKWIDKKTGWIFVSPKTRSGIRTLRVEANSVRVLMNHLEYLDLLKAANKNWKEYRLLFPSTAGTPISISNLRKEYNRLIEIAGVPKIRFHDIRHTVASILLNNKIPVGIVSKILGHSKVSVTTDIYYHFLPADSDEASKFMDNLTPTAVDITTFAMVEDDDIVEIEE